MRFIHTADWQIGMTRHFLDADAQARFSAARFDAIRAIGRLARDEGAEFVVVAGDVFESSLVDRRTVGRALEAMAEIGVPVLLLPGNHDPLDAASVYRSEEFRRRAPDSVRVLEDSEPVQVRPGVEVMGAPWRSRRPTRDLVAEALAELDPVAASVRVLVAHGAVDALSPDRDNPARIRLDAAEQGIADGRVQYVALGDRHSVTKVGDSGRVWYAGAPEATDFDEQRPGHALVVDLDPGRCDVAERAVGAWRFARQRFDLSGVGQVDSVRRWLDEQPSKDRTIARLALSGSVTLRGHAELSALLDAQRQVYAAIDAPVGEGELTVLPADGEFGDLGLSGFALTALQRLTEQAAAGGERAGEAGDALALLYRLAGGRA